MAINEGAQAVQALAQNAQQGAGQATAATTPVYPQGSAQQWQQSGQQMIAGIAPGGVLQSQAPPNYNEGLPTVVGDVASLATQAQQARADAIGGFADPMDYLNDLTSGKYYQTAIDQRQAYNENDAEAIAAYQSSGDPMLDVIMNWERPVYDEVGV